MQQNMRFFQWLAWEKNKEVVVFDHIVNEENINFIVFKNGSRCNEELIAPLNDKEITGKVMAEISGPDNMWEFRKEITGAQEEKWEENAAGEKVCVIPYNPGKTKIVPIPPRRVTSNFGQVSNFQQITQAPIVQQVVDAPAKKTYEGDPIFALLEKSKKTEQDINIILTLPLPSKGLYDVAKDSFENGDDKVTEYIVENIDMDYLKKCLQSAIKNLYEATEEK